MLARPPPAEPASVVVLDASPVVIVDESNGVVAVVNDAVVLGGKDEETVARTSEEAHGASEQLSAACRLLWRGKCPAAAKDEAAKDEVAMRRARPEDT